MILAAAAGADLATSSQEGTESLGFRRSRSDRGRVLATAPEACEGHGGGDNSLSLEVKSWPREKKKEIRGKRVKDGEKKYDEKYGRYAPEFDSLYKTPRRLTPRECARLMGFEKPEFDREANDTDFRIVCADTAAYKQFGNSVVVPVFRAVAQLIKKHM